jgi:hypothetical protein
MQRLGAQDQIMTDLGTWGTWNFDDAEVTAFRWKLGMTRFIEVERITGFPATQIVGDSFDTVSVGIKFWGATATSRLNILSSFNLGQVQTLTWKSKNLGNFRMEALDVDYEMVVDNIQTAIACTLELKRDS